MASQHANADCIIHYGDACLSKPLSSIPVHFVFNKADLDFEQFANDLKAVPEVKNETIILLYQLQYLHLAGKIKNEFKPF